MALRKEHTLLGDVYGGVTAAVVALPLALAFGVASGVGPIAGLYGAIAVGFFAAVFGGTPAQVSGPTGPMTVVMAAIVATHADNIGDAFAIVFLGGAIQVVFGLLKVGRYVSYTPHAVVSGFMSGIGIIIILIQTLPFFGLATVPGGPVGAIQKWPELLTAVNWQALVIATISLAVMIYWPKRFAAVLPAALATLIIGTLLGVVLLTGAPILASVPTGLPEFHFPLADPQRLPSFVQPAVILALLGSIDSLLTSLVADSITRTRHNSDKELIGQGIGNMAAGLIGGLPGAGATMRTVINVRAGGRTPVSGAIHAGILLTLALGLGPIAEKIPHAVLAGILMKVGWDIIDWGYLKRFRKAPRDKFIVMTVTLLLTVFVDLITAVAIGLILSGFVTAKWMQDEELKGVTALALLDGKGTGDETVLTRDEQAAIAKADGRIGIVALRGRFSYASAREIVQHVGLRTVGHDAVIYDFSDAAHIDTSAAIAIDELLERSASDTRGCYVVGLSGQAEATLSSLGVLDNVPSSRILASRLEAINDAVKLLES